MVKKHILTSKQIPNPPFAGQNSQLYNTVKIFLQILILLIERIPTTMFSPYSTSLEIVAVFFVLHWLVPYPLLLEVAILKFSLCGSMAA